MLKQIKTNQKKTELHFRVLLHTSTNMASSIGFSDFPISQILTSSCRKRRDTLLCRDVCRHHFNKVPLPISCEKAFTHICRLCVSKRSSPILFTDFVRTLCVSWPCLAVNNKQARRNGFCFVLQSMLVLHKVTVEPKTTHTEKRTNSHAKVLVMHRPRVAKQATKKTLPLMAIHNEKRQRTLESPPRIAHRSEKEHDCEATFTQRPVRRRLIHAVVFDACSVSISSLC